MTREDAIKKVRQMSLPKETMEILEALVPELHETEDERIRKEIRNFLIDMECKKEWIAYMEKLKVITATPKNWDEADERMSHPLYLEGFETGREVQKIFDEHKECVADAGKTSENPSERFAKAREEYEVEWSEEDEKMLDQVIVYDYCPDPAAKSKLKDLLKSLRPR